jgi:hypothetical protein
VVVGTQKPHWTARRRRAGRHTVGGELMGLKKTQSADGSRQSETQKHDAGLTEETDRMIREAVQNCHLIEKRKETDDMLCRTVVVRP